MHEQEFSRSFQPAIAKVFGVPMEVFAIGHELALTAQGNPLTTYTAQSFMELSKDAKKLALVMAVEVCGRLGFFSKYIFVIRVHLATDQELKCGIERFLEYRAAGSQDLPLTKMPKQHGIPFRYFGAPALASLLNYVAEKQSLLIQSHFKGSPLNFPLGLAQMLYTTSLESAGSVWVKNKQESEREQPRKEGTPPPGQNEKIFIGDEAEKVFADAVAMASKGAK